MFCKPFCLVSGDNRPGARTSIVDASDESNQTFTTSIYLNQTPPTQPRATSAQPQAPNTSSSPQSVSNNCENNSSSPTTRHVIPAKSYEQVCGTTLLQAFFGHFEKNSSRKKLQQIFQKPLKFANSLLT